MLGYGLRPNPASTWLSRRRCRGAAATVLAVAAIVASGQGGAGHSVGHFPSYYPDEIRIDVIEPEAAAAGLADKTLHAYLGATPKLAEPVPDHVKSAKSLGAFLVLSFDPASKRFASAGERCSAARGLMAELSTAKAGGFIFHPYPLTPYHADYLHHLDRIEAAKAGIGPASPPAAARAHRRPGRACGEHRSRPLRDGGEGR